tara:strand:- start:1779 stop:2207 length:429 start_codon:yes stop_codon:yes gene_type:complete
MAITPDDIIGTWHLVDTYTENADGSRTPNQGPSPKGILIYTADGSMAAITRSAVRDFPSTPEANDADRARMFDTYLSYAGRWSLDGDTVTHHTEHALDENWVGTDRKRTIDHQGDRMVLKGLAGDGVSMATIVWECAPSDGS